MISRKLMKNACWIALIATECLISSAAHRLELSRPKDGGLVPPTFDLTFELVVEGDVRAFSRDHGDASVCISLDGEEPASCFGILTTSLGVSDLPLGPHEMRMWVTANDDGGGELVLVPATLSAFTVLSDHAWREWLAKGGNASPGDLAAMEEEKRMVSPPLLEWWQNSRSSVQDGASPLPSPTAPPLSYYDSSRQQQQQRRHPWVCPRFVAGRGRGGGDEGNGDTNNEKGKGNGNGDDEDAYDVNLVIGIKSNAGRGFEARDALRRTWLPSPPSPSSSKSSTQSFCAWFLIGEPVSPSPSSSSSPPSSAESEPESEPETEFHSSLGAALELEQSTWGDLLLGPPLMFCPDHYLGLVCKTKAFMRFATQGLPLLKWRWLMLLDDDAYLKPHSLVEALVESAPSQRFYAGQVWAEHFGHPIQAMRLESHQNFLPTSAYPMDTLPPFAIGPHYLLSFDCAAFIGANFERLKGVGTLEDVSVALWLLAIQVHPTHIRHFLNARTFGCPHHGNTTGLDPGDQQANIVSLADLTPAGLFRVHAAATTASSEDDMCAGFKERWIKEPWRHDKRKSPTTEQQRADADDSEEENTVAVAAPAVAAEIGRQQEQQQEQGHQQEQEEQRPEENGDRREKRIIEESYDAGDDGGAATCLNGVCLEVLLPTMGSFHYSDGTGTGSVELKVSVAKQQRDNTSAVEDGLLELCVCVDDGERMCARLGAGGGVTGVVSLAVDGLKVGTHRVRAALVLPIVSLLPPPPPEAAEAEAEVEVLFDVVPSHEVAAAQDEQQHFSQQQLLQTNTTVTSSNTRDSPSSSPLFAAYADPTRVAVLAINLEPNSQTRIFELLATHLPRPRFDAHVFFTPTAGGKALLRGEERDTANRLLQKLVPLHAVRLQPRHHHHHEPLQSEPVPEPSSSSSSSSSSTSVPELVSLLRATNHVNEITGNPDGDSSASSSSPWSPQPRWLRREVASFVSELSTFHVATIANSLGVPEATFFAECARIARQSSPSPAFNSTQPTPPAPQHSILRTRRQRVAVTGGPLLVLELPNLNPSIQDLAHCVNALVAPSLFALAHPSVRAFKQAASSFVTESVIYPAALTPSHFSIPPPPPNTNTASSSSSTSSFIDDDDDDDGRSAASHPNTTTPTPAVFVATALVVGRLDAERSPGMALHAAARLAKQLGRNRSRRWCRENSSSSSSSTSPPPSYSRVRLRVVVVGSGQLLSGLKQLARTLFKKEGGGGEASTRGGGDDNEGEVEVSVSFLGSLPHSRVRHLMSSNTNPNSVTFLLNGRLEGETFGIANAEAVASGCVVVAFARGGNNESATAASPSSAINDGDDGDDADGAGGGGVIVSGSSVLVGAPYTTERLGNAAFLLVHRKLQLQLPVCNFKEKETSKAAAVAAAAAAAVGEIGSHGDCGEGGSSNSSSNSSRSSSRHDFGDERHEHKSAAAAAALDRFSLAESFVKRYSTTYSLLRDRLASADQKNKQQQQQQPRQQARNPAGAAVEILPWSSTVSRVGALRVAVSQGAAYVAPLLSRLLPKAFPALRLDLFIDHGGEVGGGGKSRRGGGGGGDRAGGGSGKQHEEELPAVHMAVASALDGGCGLEWSAQCQEALLKFVHRHCPHHPQHPEQQEEEREEEREEEGAVCLVVVVCGEPWDMTLLDRLFPPPQPSTSSTSTSSSSASSVSVLLLHASSNPRLLPRLWPSLHLPVASTSFGERQGSYDGTRPDRSPLALLQHATAAAAAPHDADTGAAGAASAGSVAGGTTATATNSTATSNCDGSEDGPCVCGAGNLSSSSSLPSSPSPSSSIAKWRSQRPFMAAYLYFRCDRPIRERFAVLLQKAAHDQHLGEEEKRVHFLGACDGSTEEAATEAVWGGGGGSSVGSRASRRGAGASAADGDEDRKVAERQQRQQRQLRREEFLGSRFGSGWHDDAVTMYSKFRFVVAFENGFELEPEEEGERTDDDDDDDDEDGGFGENPNSSVDGDDAKGEKQRKEEALGYVTEKMVNALLGGAIPVYWGPADVGRFFNPKTFVNCASFLRPSSSPTSNDQAKDRSLVGPRRRDRVEQALRLCAEHVVALDKEIDGLHNCHRCCRPHPAANSVAETNESNPLLQADGGEGGVDEVGQDDASDPREARRRGLKELVSQLLTQPRVTLASPSPVLTWHPDIEPAFSETAFSFRLSFIANH